MHLVDFHMWDSPTNHVLIVLFIPVKEISGVNTHTNCSLQKHIQVLKLCTVLYNIPKVPKSLYVQCETSYLPLNILLGWSFAEAFSPLALSEDAHTLLGSLQGFFFFPPPGVRRYDLNAKQTVVRLPHKRQSKTSKSRNFTAILCSHMVLN